MSDKREELMDAAESRIRSNGYDGFSFRELAAAAGIKSSSVHYYFPTKADLGAAVARRYTDRFFATLPVAPKDPVKALHEAFVRAIRSDKQACLCGVLGSVSGSLPSPVGAEAKRFFERAMEYLLEGRKRRAASGAERDWAFQVVAQLEGGMMLALALGDVAAFGSLARGLAARPTGRGHGSRRPADRPARGSRSWLRS
ncbi:MAG: TetR/AcrR family transcriptional regulator [Acidobacteriaceae bacterium]